MKKILGISLVVMAICISCSKSNPVRPPQSGNANFTINGQAFVADSGYASAQFNTITIFKDIASSTDDKKIVIDLSSLATGTYTLSVSGSEVMNYITRGTILQTSQSGIVNITSNTGTKLSGNYNAVMDGGATMSGTFTDFTIRP